MSHELRTTVSTATTEIKPECAWVKAGNFEVDYKSLSDCKVWLDGKEIEIISLKLEIDWDKGSPAQVTIVVPIRKANHG